MEVEMLTRDLSYLVEVSGGKVCLTALQLCARDIEKVNFQWQSWNLSLRPSLDESFHWNH